MGINYPKIRSKHIHCIKLLNLTTISFVICFNSIIKTSDIWLIRFIYYWNLQFLNNAILNKIYGSLPSGLGDLRRFWLSSLGSFSLLAPKDLNYSAFKYCGFERTWWKLFQKHAVRINVISPFSIQHWKVLRYQRGNQKPLIEEGQILQ